MTTKCLNEGFTLIEVLVTFILIAIGLLGLAALQVSTINTGFEAHQRALVTALVDDMAERVRMNPIDAFENYQSFDTGISCSTLENADGPLSPEDRAANDRCHWAAVLRGLSVKVNEADTRGLGAPLGAMGCLETDKRANGETVVRVAVAWQGLTAQVAPYAPCGAGLFTNADPVNPSVDEAFRRVLYRDVVVR